MEGRNDTKYHFLKLAEKKNEGVFVKYDCKRQIIGERIEAARKIRKMTQVQLADALSRIIGQSVSERTIGDIERGKRSVSAEVVCAISEALVIPPGNLLNAETGVDTDDVTVADAFHALPEDQREILHYGYSGEWDGDHNAWTYWAGMYADMPAEGREDAAYYVLWLWRKCRDEGKLHGLPINDQYVEEEWDKIYKKKTKKRNPKHDQF